MWFENNNILGTKIIGYSNTTKKLTKPPCFKKRCISDLLTPKDFQMPPTLRGYDTSYNNPLKKGIMLKNVNFVDFDHDDECGEESVAIMFNTGNKGDEHFNYMSAFENF